LKLKKKNNKTHKQTKKPKNKGKIIRNPKQNRRSKIVQHNIKFPKLNRKIKIKKTNKIFLKNPLASVLTPTRANGKEVYYMSKP